MNNDAPSQNYDSIDFNLVSTDDKNGNDCVLIVKTRKDRDESNLKDDPMCSICYYNSEDESEEEQEKQITKKTLYDTHRYGQLWVSTLESEVNKSPVYKEVCCHKFHTMCLYKWIKSSREFKCPLCRASPLSNNKKLDTVPELYGSEPEYIIQYYPNGKVQIECYKEKGVLHKFYKKYDLLGNITYECGYYKGDKHGDEIEYHIHTNKKWKKQQYRFGMKHGIYKEFSLECDDTNDQILVKYQEWQNGMLHGKEESRFLATKSKKKYCEYYEGLKHGTEKIWTITGKIIFFKKYDHGRPIGRCIVRFPDNGFLERKCYYNNYGQLDGLYMEWQYACASLTKGNKKNEKSENKSGGGFSLMGMLTGGALNLNAEDAEEVIDDKYKVNNDVVLKIKAHYSEGGLIGPFEEYHDNGVVKKISYYNNEHKLDEEYFEFDRFGRCTLRYLYDNGVLLGICERYGDNGKIKESGYYMDGLLDGIGCYRQYYTNGKLKKKQSYTYGVAHGDSIYYTQKGAISAKYKYNRGVCAQDEL